MKKQPSIALLIRSAQLWPLALEAGNALIDSGIVVAIFFLGDEVCTEAMPLDKLLKSLKDKNMNCFASQPAAGMFCLTLESMAQRFKQYDIVIPI